MSTEEIIDKVQTRFGDLDRESHHPTDGKACIMELVSWAAGEPWSDLPRCVPREIARLCQFIHDSAEPREYASIWTADRMRAVLGAASGRDAMLQRAHYAAGYARASAMRSLRARGHDTGAIDVCAPVTDGASAVALRDALRAYVADDAYDAACAYAYAAAGDAAYAYAYADDAAAEVVAAAADDAAYAAVAADADADADDVAYAAYAAACAFVFAFAGDADARQTARIEILDAWCEIGRIEAARGDDEN